MTTRAELAERLGAVQRILDEQAPITVRQCFYRLTTMRNAHGQPLLEKTEKAYQTLDAWLTKMRRRGELEFDAFVDNTRWRRQSATWATPKDYLEGIEDRYRKNLWRDHDTYVEVWLEKDALSATISDICDRYDVGLLVARGYSGVSFLHQCAEHLQDQDFEGRAVNVLYLHDFDPSGVDASRAVERDLRDMSGVEELEFVRLAVNQQQIADWNLPTRPLKAKDSRNGGWVRKYGAQQAVELDAIPPNKFRELVEEAIKDYLPDDFEEIRTRERMERGDIRRLLDGGPDLDEMLPL